MCENCCTNTDKMLTQWNCSNFTMTYTYLNVRKVCRCCIETWQILDGILQRSTITRNLNSKQSLYLMVIHYTVCLQKNPLFFSCRTPTRSNEYERKFWQYSWGNADSNLKITWLFLKIFFAHSSKSVLKLWDL